MVHNPALAVPPRQRCPVCGRFEHAQLPLPFCVRCMPPGTAAAAHAPRIVCVMQARNEARYLQGCLDHLRAHVDGFVILDDGSTDQTPGIIQAEPKLLEGLRNPVTQPHVWNELGNKQRLLDAALRHQGRWVLVCDADERFETLFLRGLRSIAAALDQRDLRILTVSLRELWDAPDRYRIDGVWGRKTAARLFRLPERISFSKARAYHDSWLPDAMRHANAPARHHALLYYHFYHLKMVHAEDRVKRRDFYKQLDPDNRFQQQGYDYLAEVDESLQLERIPEDRGYDFGTLPPDLRAMLDT